MSKIFLHLGLLLALTAVPAQAQSVQVGPNGQVQVDTGNTRVYSGNGTTNTVIQRSYQYQDNGNGSQRSYQYQNDGSNSQWNIDRDDDSAYYLVLQAPPGQNLRGRVLVNGRVLSALDRPRLVLPLAGVLRNGTNRIELRGPVSGVSLGIASSDEGRPYFRGRQLYGADQTLLQQTLSAANRTILLRVGS